MNIRKLPLAARLHRLARNEPAYPERTASIIHRVAATPITAYLEKFVAELDQLGTILELTADELGEMTYQDVAARIDKLYCQETLDRAAQALDLLAAPLVNEDRLYGPMEEV